VSRSLDESLRLLLGQYGDGVLALCISVDASYELPVRWIGIDQVERF
jgi:hypothetical protein